MIELKETLPGHGFRYREARDTMLTEIAEALIQAGVVKETVVHVPGEDRCVVTFTYGGE